MNTCKHLKTAVFILLITAFYSCQNTAHNNVNAEVNLTPKDILGNPAYRAISYGGYRLKSRDNQPTIAELKEDMNILYAMGIRIVRTYNVHLAQAVNLLQAIHELKETDDSFEMYVMLGAWINCADAFTSEPNHEGESLEDNEKEIETAISLANKYPHIVKVIAVGNEAMVKWAASYFVQPRVILKYVNQLQELKKSGGLSKDIWITSSDNFASWGGGDPVYHVEDLEKLYAAVDYICLHTYPMHDTHYNPEFWGVTDSDSAKAKQEQIDAAMKRAVDYAINQYEDTKRYMKSIGVSKPIHIGETGWASASNGFYGKDGSRATDEYKEAIYHNLIRDWTDKNNISCFYFEAFDEPWKDAGNPGGSENHFGLFTVDGQAKYALWNKVDENIFEGLKRGKNKISKTFDGDKDALMESVFIPPVMQKKVAE